MKLSVGKLVIKLEGERTDSRDYYFVERDLGEGALATMAVRIAPNGTDLFIEWRHHTTGSWETMKVARGDGCVNLIGFVLLASVMLAIFAATGGPWVLGVGGGLVIAGCIKLLTMKERIRLYGLKGFQGQESTVFQLSIRAALQEAIYDAGIAHSLLRGLDPPSGPNEPLI